MYLAWWVLLVASLQYVLPGRSCLVEWECTSFLSTSCLVGPQYVLPGGSCLVGCECISLPGGSCLVGYECISVGLAWWVLSRSGRV